MRRSADDVVAAQAQALKRRGRIEGWQPGPGKTATLRSHVVQVDSVDSRPSRSRGVPIVHHDVTLVIHALGGFRMEVGGVDVTGRLWNRRKPRTLFKLLLASYDRVVPSDIIEEMMWPDLSPQGARHSLHVCVRRVREALEKLGLQRVETRPEGYCLCLRTEDWFDVREYEALTRTALRVLDERPVNSHALEVLDDVTRLYQGDLYAEEQYADWVAAPRERLRFSHLQLLGRAFHVCRDDGHDERAMSLLQAYLEGEPGDEARTVQLVECLLERDDIGGARAVVERACRVLREELDVPPGPALAELEEQLDASRRLANDRSRRSA